MKRLNVLLTNTEWEALMAWMERGFPGPAFEDLNEKLRSHSADETPAFPGLPSTPDPERFRMREIKKRCEAATPGPWFREGAKVMTPDTHPRSPERLGTHVGSGGYVRDHVPVVINSDPECDPPSFAAVDAEFIAHARADVPWLFGIAEIARELLDEMYDEHPTDPSRYTIVCDDEDLLPLLRRLRAALRAP